VFSPEVAASFLAWPAFASARRCRPACLRVTGLNNYVDSVNVIGYKRFSDSGPPCSFPSVIFQEPAKQCVRMTISMKGCLFRS
jgi:hypothetical protein